MLLAMIAVSLIVPLHADGDEATHSDGLVNGRGWRSMTAEQRIFYISGFREGMETLALTQCKTGDYACFEAKVGSILPKSANNAELTECLNEEYEDPTTRNIPVPAILQYICNARFRGVDRENTDKARNRLTKSWSTY